MTLQEAEKFVKEYEYLVGKEILDLVIDLLFICPAESFITRYYPHAHIQLEDIANSYIIAFHAKRGDKAFFGSLLPLLKILGYPVPGYHATITLFIEDRSRGERIEVTFPGTQF